MSHWDGFLRFQTLTQPPAASPTSLGVVEVDKLVPLVVREEAEDSAAEGRAHLDDKLHLVIGGVTGCDKGGVQSAAERGQRVHGLLVVESEDGVDAAGELGANCRKSREQEVSQWNAPAFMVNGPALV